jgi:hypothetical protein
MVAFDFDASNGSSPDGETSTAQQISIQEDVAVQEHNARVRARVCATISVQFQDLHPKPLEKISSPGLGSLTAVWPTSDILEPRGRDRT